VTTFPQQITTFAEFNAATQRDIARADLTYQQVAQWIITAEARSIVRQLIDQGYLRSFRQFIEACAAELAEEEKQADVWENEGGSTHSPPDDRLLMIHIGAGLLNGEIA